MAGLPHDKNSSPVPALFPALQQTVTVASSSARTAANFGANTLVVELTPTKNMFVLFGDSTATADSNDIYLAAGVVYTYATNGHSRIAAIRATADGTLYVTELQ
tara:strand:- start:358 stop:669 length:312 start_codon:yes stop_codon:yes gene_type:complete